MAPRERMNTLESRHNKTFGCVRQDPQGPAPASVRTHFLYEVTRLTDFNYKCFIRHAIL